MSNSWAICKREIKAFFTTPVGYIILGTFALISGLGFTGSFLFYALMTESPSTYGFAAVPDFEETFFSPFLVYAGTIMMFIGPLITMRLLAEERNRGTIEMLLTHPVRDRDIIAGKYLSSVRKGDFNSGSVSAGLYRSKDLSLMKDSDLVQIRVKRNRNTEEFIGWFCR